MSADANPRTAFDLERKILSALCNAPATRTEVREEADARTRNAILTALRTHQWQDPEHRVVFEALISLPERNPNELREQLPAQATRMGFPDVNWDEYFALRAADSPIESLITELLTSSRR
jgi:hypothetical protein